MRYPDINLLPVVLSICLIPACEPSPTEGGASWHGFREMTPLAGGDASLRKLRAIDVTGDGQPDLVAALSTAGVRVWRNESAGRFAPPVDHPIGSDVTDVGAGDINGDGVSDLIAIAHFGNAVFVRMGIGSGMFGPPSAYALRNHGRIVRVEDVDEDGLDDVIAVHDGSGQPVYTTLFLGTADGALRRTWEASSVFANARDLALGDFNGDGDTDFAIATGDDRAALLLYYSEGNGGFGSGIPVPSPLPGMPDGITRIDAGDVNGDGIGDIVSAHYEPSHQVGIWRGTRTGIAAPVRLALDGPGDVVLADLDRDGAADGLVTQLDAGNLTILFGNGDGTFRDGSSHALDPGANDIARADFDGDGWVDVAVLSIVTNRVRVLLNRSAT